MNHIPAHRRLERLWTVEPRTRTRDTERQWNARYEIMQVLTIGECVYCDNRGVRILTTCHVLIMPAAGPRHCIIRRLRNLNALAIRSWHACNAARFLPRTLSINMQPLSHQTLLIHHQELVCTASRTVRRLFAEQRCAYSVEHLGHSYCIFWSHR
jgi:hypothetical protein